MRAEREAKKLAEKMQTKLALCPGFVGCHPGGITAQPGAIDEAIEFLKRRFYVGQPQWKRGIGMTIPGNESGKGTDESGGAPQNLRQSSNSNSASHTTSAAFERPAALRWPDFARGCLSLRRRNRKRPQTASFAASLRWKALPRVRSLTQSPRVKEPDAKPPPKLAEWNRSGTDRFF